VGFYAGNTIRVVNGIGLVFSVTTAGFAPNGGTFYYESPDCSGTAYLQSNGSTVL